MFFFSLKTLLNPLGFPRRYAWQTTKIKQTSKIQNKSGWLANGPLLEPRVVRALHRGGI